MFPIGTILERNMTEDSDDEEFYTVTSNINNAPDWVLLGEYDIHSFPEEKEKEEKEDYTVATNCHEQEVEKIRKFLSSKNVKDLRGVSDNFISIFDKLNSSEKGKISETVFKLAIFLKIEIPEIPEFPLDLNERNQKCFKINDIGFGVKSGGCDIMATSDNYILAGTAKIEHINSSKKTQWGQIEWQNVFVEAGLFGKYRNYKQVFLALVGDKTDIKDRAVPSLIKEKFPDDRCVVLDIKDVSNLWVKVIEVFSKHNWDNQTIEESVRDRMTLSLRPHQKECVKHAVERLSNMNKKEGYLIADKPRAGKTIMFAEIIRNLWEEKNSGV